MGSPSDRSQPLLGREPDTQESPLVLNLSSASTFYLYVSFLLLGFGCVLPTYVIFAAVDYFNDVSPGGDIEFSLNLVFNGMLLLVSVANALWFTKHGFTIRILGGFGAISACMAAVPILDQLRGMGPSFAHNFRTIVVVIAALLGAADAFAQASIFGLTSAAFPPLYTQALMFGISICGTSITFARIACKALTDDLRISSYIFFAIASLYSLGAVFLFAYLRLRHALFRRHIQAATKTSPTLARRAYQRSPPGSMQKPPDSLSFAGQACTLLRSWAVLEPCMQLVVINAQQSVTVPSIVGLSLDFIGAGWYQVLAILSFNLGDMLGRGPLAAYCSCPMQLVWPAILARFGLNWAMCLCVPPYALSYHPLPMPLLGFALGLTTGYLATSVATSVATRVSAKDRETSGYLTILAIFLGLMGGSFAAIPLKALIQID